MNLKGLTALITGGSEGIGFAIADMLLQNNVNVCIVSRSEEKLAKAKESLKEKQRLLCVATDVTDEQQVQLAVDKTVQTYGKIDILVNSAGTSLRKPTPFEETSIEEYYRVTDLNVAGILMMTKSVLPGMKSRNYGYILTILSTAAYRAMPENSLYAASKYAARAFTEALSEELKETGIRITSISPGPTATSIWTHKEKPPEKDKLNTMLKPSDIAAIAEYLFKQPDYVYIDNITVVPRNKIT